MYHSLSAKGRARFRSGHLVDHARLLESSRIVTLTQIDRGLGSFPGQSTPEKPSGLSIRRSYRVADRQPCFPHATICTFTPKNSGAGRYGAAAHLSVRVMVPVYRVWYQWETIETNAIPWIVWSPPCVHRTSDASQAGNNGPTIYAAYSDNRGLTDEGPTKPYTFPHPLFGPHICPFPVDAKKVWVEQWASNFGSSRGNDPRGS